MARKFKFTILSFFWKVIFLDIIWYFLTVRSSLPNKVCDKIPQTINFTYAKIEKLNFLPQFEIFCMCGTILPSVEKWKSIKLPMPISITEHAKFFPLCKLLLTNPTLVLLSKPQKLNYWKKKVLKYNTTHQVAPQLRSMTSSLRNLIWLIQLSLKLKNPL